VFREDELWSANARFTHVDGDRSFFFDEVLSGTSSFGAAQNRQIVVAGNGRQPVTSGNLAFYLFPRGALTVANQTSFYNRRLEGDNSFRELDNASLSLALLNFQLLGIRTISNTTDATYRAAKWLGIYGGYRYASRRIRSVEQEEFFGQADAVRAEQDNRLHSGLLGFRLRPVQGLTVNVDGEIGRADRPFFPIGRRNFHLLRARAQYKRGTLSLGVSARANYNFNSVSLAQHSARSRDYMLTGSWTPRSWFAIDGTYSKIHLDTLSGVAYFSMGELLSGRSAYLSNIHTGIVTARFEFLGRAALSAGFSRVRDTADPGASSGLFSDPVAFPLTFDSPLARFSVRIHQRLRLNAGYQFYRYDERLLPRDYRAHTGYTSLSWSF
jgi:hypothetical protein